MVTEVVRSKKGQNNRISLMNISRWERAHNNLIVILILNAKLEKFCVQKKTTVSKQVSK